MKKLGMYLAILRAACTLQPIIAENLPTRLQEIFKGMGKSKLARIIKAMGYLDYARYT